MAVTDLPEVIKLYVYDKSMLCLEAIVRRILKEVGVVKYFILEPESCRGVFYNSHFINVTSRQGR